MLSRLCFSCFCAKPRVLRVQSSLANWLHAVAVRIALKSRVTLPRRLHRENKAVTPTPSDPFVSCEVMARLRALLDQELERLPEKYRESPLALCYLEGLSYTKRVGAAVGLEGRHGDGPAGASASYCSSVCVAAGDDFRSGVGSGAVGSDGGPGGYDGGGGADGVAVRAGRRGRRRSRIYPGCHAVA